MNATDSARSVYRKAGWLALAHAAVALAILMVPLLYDQNGIERPLVARFWIGLVTLWFLWPLVLALHRGRTVRRLAVFAAISGLLLLPSLVVYNMEAPRAFGLPWGVALAPWSVWKYFSAYRLGHAQAKKDIAGGVLATEVYGFGAGFGHAPRILRTRYHIETRPTAGCLVDERILGHAAGYNAVSEPEIDRRIGRSTVEAAREEGHKLDAEESARHDQYRKDLAKRLSHFPSKSKITLESVSPWMDNRLEIDPASEQRLGEFIREIERFVAQAVPNDAPAFDLRVSATLTSTERPRFETSASLSAPTPVYDRIYQNLPNLPLPPWNQGRLSVGLEFKISGIP